MNHKPEKSSTHKSGFVNIIGNPNVGKSTLMNALIGEKLSIITSKAQTTRHRILGILNDEKFQIVFSDTPGVISAKYELQNAMMGFVKSAFEDADILIYMVEIDDKGLKDEALLNRIKNVKTPLILIINKIDLTDQETLDIQVSMLKTDFPQAEIFPASAKNKFYIKEILNRILELLPEGPAYFDKNAITDRPERFFVNEVIREKVLKFYNKEIPYSVEVLTESFLEEEKIIRIESTLITERETQKGILLGHKGMAIKKVGTKARQDLEVFFNKKIFLKIRIKVIKDWRKNPKYLNQFGYSES